MIGIPVALSFTWPIKFFHHGFFPTLPGHPGEEPHDADDITAFAEAIAEGALLLR